MGNQTRVAAALFFSGAAALVYQIVWVRELGLVLGNTYEAVATVLATFMAGLGLGGMLAARWVDRQTRFPLPRLFAILELATAALALALPWLFSGLVPLLRVAAETPVLLGLLRVVASAMGLLLPTTLMGATLPVLLAHLERVHPSRRGLGASAGFLYAANTAGAVVGSLSAGTFLIGAVGMTVTTLLAVASNVTAAALVATSRSAPRDSAASRAPESSLSPGARAGLAVALLSGLGALVSEVAWTRALVLVIGPTSYGFSFIVSAVIAGLALGSAVGSRWARASSLRPLFLVQLGAAAACLVLVPILPELVLPVGELVRANPDEMAKVLTTELLWVQGLLLAPSFCFGATFPLVVAIVGGAPGRASGLTLSWNTAGAVTGSVVAGFLVLPLGSIEATLYLAVAAHAVAAAVCLPRRVPAVVVALGLVVAASFGIPRWDREVISGGLYKYAPYLERAEFVDFLQRGELSFYRQDRAATVSVKSVGSHVSLAVDGKVDATNKEDLLTQRLLAHVPLLLHPGPRDVLVVGLGSGVTAGAALTHPVGRVDAVEISPGVVEALPFFADVNHRPTEDDRFRLSVDDARNHLLLQTGRYDVIISEPSNPWMAGVSGLFTRELFRLARERLRPGGLFCQWAHLYNMADEDLKTLVGTFTDVFHDTALFALSESDILLVGASGSFSPPPTEELQARLARESVRRDLAPVGVESLAGLGLLYAASTPALSDWARDAERHTDDRPILEFRAPYAMHADTSRTNLAALLELSEREGEPALQGLRGEPSGTDLRARARALEDAESYGWALETYGRALSLEPGSLDAQEGLARMAAVLGQPESAEDLLGRLAEDAAPVEARIALAYLYRLVGRLDDAIRLLYDALRLDPERREALLLAAEVSAEKGEVDAMANLCRAVLRRDGLDAEAASLLAESTLRRGDYALAAEQSSAILNRRPEVARAQKVQAIALAELGRVDQARGAFDKLVRLEPDDFVHWNNYGALELRSGDPARAADWFERAVDLDPRNLEGYEGLKEAATLAGDRKRRERAESMLSSHRSRASEPVSSFALPR